MRDLMTFDRLTPFALLMTLVFWSAPPLSAAEPIEGRATIVDGDTIAVEGTKERIRLYGIDAPEGKQTCDDSTGRRYLCGSRSADALAAIIGRNGRVRCTEEDRDRYGRIVAECATDDNRVLGAELVRQGWALHFQQYSDGRYNGEEAEAKAARSGLWAGHFVEPWKWRRGERLQTEGVAVVEGQRPPSAQCLNKGNISSGGRIYHMPNQQNYERTRIDITAGEHWFCSEAEAKASGWRRAKQ